MPRAGSPHPNVRRRRQGSPHPKAITADSPDFGPASPSPCSEDDLSPQLQPQVVQDNIPDFVSMAPSIFVPATFDYTQPRPSASLPSDDSTRVDRALAELEVHMDAVKRNIATMVLQQARKVQQEAAAQEFDLISRGFPPPRSKRLPPTRADEEALIRSLKTRKEPGQQCGVRPEWSAAEVPMMWPNPKDSPREAAVTKILDFMRFGTFQMEGYETHCKAARMERRAQVAREVAEQLAKELSAENIMNEAPSITVADGKDDEVEGAPMDID